MISSGSDELGYRWVCSDCANAEVARSEGLEGFSHPRFEPVRLTDYSGREHEFHFRTRLFGPGVSINAFELLHGVPGGYEFQVIGEPSEDLMVLFGRLIEKTRRALARRHLVEGELGTRIADDGVVRGSIDWDDSGLPRLQIDGRSIDWEHFGRLLMTYEGWQFHLRLLDPSEEA